MPHSNSTRGWEWREGFRLREYDITDPAVLHFILIEAFVQAFGAWQECPHDMQLSYFMVNCGLGNFAFNVVLQTLLAALCAEEYDAIK